MACIVDINASHIYGLSTGVIRFLLLLVFPVGVGPLFIFSVFCNLNLNHLTFTVQLPNEWFV